MVSLALIGGIGLTGATLSFYTEIQLAPVDLVIVIAYMYLINKILVTRKIKSSPKLMLALLFVGIVAFFTSRFSTGLY